MRTRRGLSIIEIIIALAVAMFGFVTLVSVFRSSYQHATMSRNRTVGCGIMQSLLDEIEEHPYGTPAPKSWGVEEEVPCQLWIEGRPQDMTFHKKLEFQNGSFVDKSKTDQTDFVTITLSWKEGVGRDESPHPVDDKQIVVKVPVWR